MNNVKKERLSGSPKTGESWFTQLKTEQIPVEFGGKKLKGLVTKARKARERVAQLRASVALIRIGGGGTADAKRRDGNIASGSKSSEKGGKSEGSRKDHEGGKNNRVNSRNNNAGFGGGNTIPRSSGKMVPVKLGGKNLNMALHPYVPWHAPRPHEVRETGRDDSSSSEEETSHEPVEKPSSILAQRLKMSSPWTTAEEGPPVALSVKAQHTNKFEPSMQAIMTKYGPGIRVRGREFLNAMSTPSTVVSRGSMLQAYPLNPSVIPDQRLVLLAEMYTKFIFKTFRVSYLPTVGTQQNGSLMMYGDYDPQENGSLYGGDGNLRYAYVHDFKENSIWESQQVTMTDEHYADMLFVDPNDELRWCCQGNFWVLATGALPTNTELGKLVLDYEVDFALEDFGGPVTTPNSYSSLTINLPATGINAQMVATGVFANGLYVVSFLTNPTQTETWASSQQASKIGPYFNVVAGTLLFGYAVGNTMTFATSPILNLENQAVDPNQTCCVNPATLAGTVVVNLFQINAPTLNG